MTAHTLNVINVINSLSVGGAEKLLTRFAAVSRNRLKKPICIMTIYDNISLTNVGLENNVQLNNLHMKRKFDIRVVPKIVRKIRKSKYNIVHVHLFPASLFVALASYFFNRDVRLVFTEHNVYNRRRLIPWFKIMDRLIYSRYEKIVCVSEMVNSELTKWLPRLERKTIVIKNGIPIPKTKRSVNKNYDIIFVGRLTRAKGVDILLHSLAVLKSRGVIKKAVIVGEGPLLFELRTQAHRLGIDHLVFFLGVRDDVEILLQQSRIFVSPSRWEGLPLSVLEAMAAGLPVIASKVGGIPEVITNDRNGVLIPPNEPELLADAIQRILKGKKFAERIGRNARRSIEKEYSIGKYSRNITKLYQILGAEVK